MTSENEDCCYLFINHDCSSPLEDIHILFHSWEEALQYFLDSMMLDDNKRPYKLPETFEQFKQLVDDEDYNEDEKVEDEDDDNDTFVRGKCKFIKGEYACVTNYSGYELKKICFGESF
jgi:hypothetical protein